MERPPSILKSKAALQAPGEISSRDPALVDLQFQVGQKVSATVLEILGPGRVLVGLRGIKVEAKTHLPLQEGKTYAFVVKEAGERILLGPPAKGALSPSREAGVLARLLAKAGGRGFPSAFRALLGLAREGRLPRALAEGVENLARPVLRPEQVEALLRDLGLHHEGRLARALREGRPPPPDLARDLKALLLEALGGEAEGKQGGEEVRRAVKAALEVLEGLQAENLHRLRAGGGERIPLPLVPGMGSGELHLFPPIRGEGEEEGEERKEGRPGGERPFRVVFLLELERLGPLRVDAEVRNRGVRALFRVGWDRAEERVRRALPGLREALARGGLEPLSLEVRRAEGEGTFTVPMPAGPGLERGHFVDVEG